MPTLQTAKRRWARLSLATFFFASLCLTAAIIGYRSGYQCGYNSGPFSQNNAPDPQVTETYNIAQLILPDVSAEERASEFNELKDLIQSTIYTDVWDQSGNKVRNLPDSQSMTVTAPGSVQTEIHDLLNQLENLSTRETADDLLPSLQGLASRGQTRDYELPNSPPVDSPTAKARAKSYVEKYFNATVAGVSKHWGPPGYRGENHDADYPQWSHDQKIATWPRGKGLSYVAIRGAADGQLHMIVGWHENS